MYGSSPSRVSRAAQRLALWCAALGFAAAGLLATQGAPAATRSGAVHGLVARCPRITGSVIRPCSVTNARVTLLDAHRRRVATVRTKRGRFAFRAAAGSYLLIAEPGGCRSRATIEARRTVTVNVTCIVG